MRNILTLAFLAIATLTMSAQSQVETMMRDAKIYNDAYLNKDFSKFVDYTVPYVIDIAGGTDFMIDNTKTTYEMTTQGGLEFISIDALKPGKIMIAGKELHAILPQTVINKAGDTKFGRTTYFLAVSQNDGSSWTFLDLEPYDAESIKTFVPSWSGDLEFPAVEMPQIIEE